MTVLTDLTVVIFTPPVDGCRRCACKQLSHEPLDLRAEQLQLAR
jgi:hypothetical protein